MAGQPKRKEKRTDQRFSYLDSTQSRSQSSAEAVYQLRHEDGRIETNLSPADIERRIRARELSGVEWVSRGPGNPWVRIAEDALFCELILHGLEQGHFRGAPRRPKRTREPSLSKGSAGSLPPAPQFSGLGVGTQVEQGGGVVDLQPGGEDIQVQEDFLLPASGSVPFASEGEAAIGEKTVVPLRLPLPKVLMAFAALCVLGGGLYVRKISELASVAEEGKKLPQSWRPLTVNLVPPVSKKATGNELAEGLREAKSYYYRDTPFFYRAALKRFWDVVPYQTQSAIIWSGIIESYAALHTFAEDRAAYFANLHQLADRALSFDPYSAHLKRAKARIFLEEGMLAPARDTLREALKVDDKNPESLLLAGRLSVAAGDTAGAGAFFSQAESMAKTLVEDGVPYFGELHRNYAHYLFTEGKWVAAAEQTEKVLSINTIHPSAYLLKAKILTAQEKYAEAMTAVEQSTALSFFGTMETAAEARYQKGLLHEKLDEKNRAKLEFQQALLLAPDNALYQQTADEKKLAPLEIAKWDIIKAFGDATFFVKTGKSLLEKGRLTDALSQLEIAKLMAPDRADVYFLIGQVVERTGDFTRIEESINAYEKAVEIDKKMIEAHVRLGDLYRRYYLFEKAFKHLNEALEIYPKHPEANFYMGRYYEDRAIGESGPVESEVKKAIDYYDLARINAPDMREAVIHMCDLAEQLNVLPDAEAFYRRFLSFFPDDLEIQLRLHVNRAKQGRKAIAIQAIKSLMEKDSSPMIEGALGLAYIYSNDLNRGVDILRKGVDRGPKVQWLRKILAETYKKLGRMNDAIIQYKAMSYVDPSDAYGFFQAGQLLYEENKLEMALIEFKNAVAINYRYPLVHARMADIYQKLNQPNEAVVALKKEIQKNPRLVKYRVQLAEMLLRYNYLEEAADVLLEALTIEEKNLPLLYLMARVRHEQGIREVKNGLGREKLEAALNYVRLGLSYFPDAAKLFLEKGLIMRDLGDGQQAAEYLQKYLDLDPLALDRMQVLDVMKKL